MADVLHFPTNLIPAMSDTAIGRVRDLETEAAKQPQTSIDTHHAFHAGLYARTIRIPASVMITGALIKVATTLIVSGDAIMYTESGSARLTGYYVLAARAHRKQAFLALTDTYLTMLFATEAKTVAEAEAEFTDEADLLMSRRPGATNIVED